ncbi:MAG: class C sortase [Ruminococcus sp.]|nr:class C sortase [Ruminococcus sp.]MBO5382775.1 class C sortase [Ruminococcus sp.]
MKKKKKQSKILTIILIIIFLVGLSVMLYPTVSNYINTKHQSYAIAKYDEQINNMSDSRYYEIMAQAQYYNERLKNVNSPLTSKDGLPKDYKNVLDVTGTGIMGYITIPQIQIQLPIYHGTSEAVLNIAVGHLEGSSLPIGGTGTHSVLSAHRGLPSAKLFSDLDKLVVGDLFTVTILNEVLTYEIDQILIVKPYEMEKLARVEGNDYITLLTCTPYGVNTHRLLVRGKRIETEAPEMQVRVSADAVQIERLVVASIVVIPMLVLTFLLMMIIASMRNLRKKGKSRNKAGEEDEML